MSSINSGNIDETNKEMNAGGDQGQGLEASYVPESDHKNDKDMAQAVALHSEPISDANESTKLSEDCANTNTIPEDTISSEPHEPLNVGSITIVTSEPNQTNNLSSDVQCIGASSDSAHDLQRNSDTKSPEMLIDEVREEVTKLNISGEEPKAVLRPSVTSSKVELRQENDSLRNLLVYDGDSGSESDSQEEDHINKPDEKKSNLSENIKKQAWRKDHSGSSDSETDSSASTLSSDSGSDSDNSDGDSASVIFASDDGMGADGSALIKSTDKGAVKKTNKIAQWDEYLPPIPDLTNLNISSAEEFMHIGLITSIITDLVTIEAIPGTPAFDLDSMLFIDDQTTKKPLGPIFDVLGPVSEPIYCVRFNSEDEIKKLGVKFGMKVYAAPKSEAFTKFVFVKELMKIKGTDASWLNDQEQPVELAEYSDDEMERQARKPKNNSKRKLDDSSLERHKKYEKTMNQCNTLNTRVCRLVDAQKHLSKQIRTNQHQSHFQEPVPAPPGMELPTWIPPEFNPAVPPPVFGHPTPYGWPVVATPSPPAGHPNPFSSGGRGKYPVAQPTPTAFGSTAQFGTFYANQAFAPQTMGPPAARSQSRSLGRAQGLVQRLRQNSDNYFSNNSRNRDAGPSSQPF